MSVMNEPWSQSSAASGGEPTARPMSGKARALQVLLVLLALSGALAAVLVTYMGLGMREEAPEFAGLFWPLLITSYYVIACGEAFLFCLWQLVRRVTASVIFDPRSLPWVRGLSATCLLAAAGMVVAHLLIPGPFLVVAAPIFGCIVLLAMALVVEILRYLLIRATGYEQELAEVI